MKWVGRGLAAVVVACAAGCGGDSYESQFNASLQQLKATGQPIPRSMQMQTTAPSPAAAAEIEKLKGTWKATSVQKDGADHPEYVRAGMQTVFTDNSMTISVGDDAAAKTNSFYRLDPTKNPKEIDLIDSSGQPSGKGIYALDGDKLTLCTSTADRPTSLATKQGDGLQLVVLKRAQGEKK
jgi:uncharacterized protein (TIGR03067 family)